jgi:hypothetical protein
LDDLVYGAVAAGCENHWYIIANRFLSQRSSGAVSPDHTDGSSLQPE